MIRILLLLLSLLAAELPANAETSEGTRAVGVVQNRQRSNSQQLFGLNICGSYAFQIKRLNDLAPSPPESRRNSRFIAALDDRRLFGGEGWGEGARIRGESSPHPNPLPQEFGSKVKKWKALLSEFSGERGLIFGAQLTANAESAVEQPFELGKRQWLRLLTLQDYNTRVVVLGTCLLGMASGLVGSFTLLRKRALMGDALAHATLPGIGLAFMLATILGADGKSLPVLLLGAAVTGLFGVGAILFIRNATRLKEDVALAVVLSVFFGAGLALLGVVQQMQSGHAAGLEAFIYGKTASMIAGDAALIGGSAFLCLLVCVLLFKEFKLLCFDEAFAGARGFPPVLLDIVLMAVVVTITIVGLQAVGLVLMIALLVIPAAAARFWSDRLRSLAILSSLIGGAGSLIGASLSAVLPKLPSGAMIVLTSSCFFVVSMLCGTSRGVLIRFFRRTRLNQRIDRQHLLRAMYELLESRTDTGQPFGPSIARKTLLAERSWGSRRLARCIRRCQAEGLVFAPTSETVELTDKGFIEAERLTREHRLWELYLITHADIAPSRVDRDADAIEHVLEPEMVQKLSRLLDDESGSRRMPQSPHAARPDKHSRRPKREPRPRDADSDSTGRKSSRRARE